MATQDTTGKKFMRETDARILIDRRLREADWDIEEKNQVSTEETSQSGRADYILKDSRGRAIAVIEAKRFAVDPASAKQQALSYAESINAILKKFKLSGLNKNRCQSSLFQKSITKAVNGECRGHIKKKRCRLWIKLLREANARCSWLWQQAPVRPTQ